MPGSGLGLPIVRQAAEAHGGWVTATNAPNGGAVVQIQFGPSVKLAEPLGSGEIAADAPAPQANPL